MGAVVVSRGLGVCVCGGGGGGLRWNIHLSASNSVCLLTTEIIKIIKFDYSTEYK